MIMASRLKCKELAVQILLFCFLSITTFAAEKTISGEEKTVIIEYKYSINENEDLDTAKNNALLFAQREALEQVGTFLEGNTKVKNGVVINDEIKAFVAGYIRKMDILIAPKVITKDNAAYLYLKVKVIIGSTVKTSKTQTEIDVDNNNKRQANYWFSEGERYFQQNSYKEALNCFSRVIDFNAEYVAAYFKRGQVLEQLGFIEQSRIDYGKAAELEPQNELYKQKVREIR